MFSSEYSEIFKNTYFEEHLQVAASDDTASRNKHGKLHVKELAGSIFCLFWHAVVVCRKKSLL